MEIWVVKGRLDSSLTEFGPNMIGPLPEIRVLAAEGLDVSKGILEGSSIMVRRRGRRSSGKRRRFATFQNILDLSVVKVTR